MALLSPANVERAVTQVRVLLAKMPRMLHDILGSMIATQTDLELMGGCDAPDVVVVDGEPRFRVLSLVAGGRRAVVYELQPRGVAPASGASAAAVPGADTPANGERSPDELSLDGLLEAIRTAAKDVR